MITKLLDNEIFVFGSNIQGHHAGGAAFQAHQGFGAARGVGEGLTGQCYALPTLNETMQHYSHIEMLNIVATFYRCVKAHPELTFLLTPVGTGIAGYSEEYIGSLFGALPRNVRKVGWEWEKVS